MERLEKKYKNTCIDTSDLDLVKATLNDYLSDYLTFVKQYKKSNLIVDIRNDVGILSTIITLVVLYYSLKVEFEKAKKIIAWLCAIYYIMNNLLELIVWLRYSNMIFMGTKNKKVEDQKKKKSKNKKETTESKIRIICSDQENNYEIIIYKNDNIIPIKYHRYLGDLFDEKGYFLYEEFTNDCDNVFLGF
ncbi:Signal peptidase 25 kDa subunit [Spraguea lophii 42_110]|uniref:Signal peptidase complex subunit 2 n=1 Tax=Spraguea lophii (strain 42_110) TaxID=1358809 RepID=S7WBK3_SPRLO|nr:Signal peptidase 25 kDa subunit [Spraguea lophii 42_110]